MLKFSFRQQVLAGFVVSIVLVFVVAILSYNSIRQLEDDTKWVDHTQKVIKNSTNLLQYLVDAETGMRGFGATGDKRFLDPYNAAIPKITDKLDSLKNLTVDNPTQVGRIDSLNKLVSTQLNILKENILTRESKGLDYMVQNSMFLRGKSNMDSIRYLKDRINGEEGRLLVVRKASSEAQSTAAIFIIASGSLIFLIIILVLFFYIQKTFAKQKKIEADILKTNDQLENVLEENENKNWLLTGTGALSDIVQGEQSEQQLAEKVIKAACEYTGAQAGTFYLFNEADNWLEFKAAYAFHDFNAIKKQIKLNEGWVGQAVTDGKTQLIKGRVNLKLELQSSLLEQEITETFIVPFFFDKKLKGVFEIAFQNGLSSRNEGYLKAIADIVGVSINTAQSRTIMHDLFEEVQQQAEELEAQQEEMRVTNEELMKKTEMLQASEEELRVQQEELRTTNAELEEKASLLEEKNQAIEEARRSISQKMRELETTGKYKSEFLANMSHELRTPLNSILVLARILKDNKAQTLTEDQIKYSTVIFNAGNDLLTLINDILDLSKIESGKLEILNEKVKVSEILKDVESLFAEVAKNKNITFTTQQNNNVPEYILTDMVRSQQVIKNLLSNAFKFTSENGSVSVIANLDETGKNLALSIKDSGIGIPYDKQKLIFEAFQQADGSTSRKYGGTGLGLSISRELTHLLGGAIKLKSKPGEGSEFTLLLPLEGVLATPIDDADNVPTLKSWIAEDGNASPFKLEQPLKLDTLRKGRTEPLVVIVEDDKNFAAILQDYAKEHGYQSILVHDGDQAVETVQNNHPDAVILDIMLPGKDGWQILKELKNDPETAGIPVHLMSAGDAAVNRVRKEGAISFLKKPINTEVLDKLFKDMAAKTGNTFKQILLIEDHKMQSHALRELMEKQGITVDQAFDGESAFRMLTESEYQCVILDINLPDISGLDLLDKIKEVERFAELPVIVNTAMELDKTSVSRLMQYANAMVVKNNKSSERLIDEVNLFLNKINSMAGKAYPANAEPTKAKSYSGDKNALKNKKILIVDDDMRNIFALSSALQTYDMQVEIANDGEESLTKLEETAGIDMVLMDIMMPKMDGYDAMRHIRKQQKWAKLPIIALTAKAMKEDRDKCIEAGANDYITKPVDVDRLLALMQIWLEQ
ncbi:response regulator [Mucilaginibacter paludis]|uniref:histidine kinase n=1 Tax=Mucilaginibacter paludis DSM 18603 TaxID=714943 RepID=H1Y7G8_9SPHI|nr:response regulator [Mucilaginibacter paludis]EHQ29389.1 multi-sensor hybrid histidine kinase [Mucilaginibacter paludis DSM 18603]